MNGCANTDSPGLFTGAPQQPRVGPKQPYPVLTSNDEDLSETAEPDDNLHHRFGEFELKRSAHAADIKHLGRVGWLVRAGFGVLTGAIGFVVASLVFN